MCFETDLCQADHLGPGLQGEKGLGFGVWGFWTQGSGVSEFRVQGLTVSGFRVYRFRGLGVSV